MKKRTSRRASYPVRRTSRMPKSKQARAFQRTASRMLASLRRNSGTPQLWVWNWVGGGYNSAHAISKADALSIATKMGAPRSFNMGGKVVRVQRLVPDEKSLRIAKPGELAKLDYGSD